MSIRPIFCRAAVAAITLATASFAASAQEQVLNLYSARHYQTDEALYANFTKAFLRSGALVDAFLLPQHR